MDVDQILSELKNERSRLDQAIAALSGAETLRRRGRPPKAQSSQPERRTRTMSPAARKRISDAMRKRWAERKNTSAGRKGAPKAKNAKASINISTARGRMSPAARRKLSRLMKARWAARKKAAAA